MNIDNIRNIIAYEVDALAETLEDAGAGYASTIEDVRRYAAEQADALSRVVGQPGFDVAARSVALDVAGYAALEAVSAGDEIDAAAQAAFVAGMTSALRVLAQVIVIL